MPCVRWGYPTLKHAVTLMLRTNLRLILSLASLAFGGSIAVAQEEAAAEEGIFIAFSAPLPDVATSAPAGTIAHTIGALNELRKTHDGLIYIHAGGGLGPSILSNYDKGVHAIEITNLLRPDAYNVSRGDYAYGDDQVSIRTREAAFPLLSANTTDKETGLPAEGLLPSVVIERGGYRVGVIGSTGETLAAAYTTRFTDVGDSMEAIRAEAVRLREQGVDPIIAVLNTNEPGITEFRAANVPVDIIFQNEPQPESQDGVAYTKDFFTDTETGEIILAFLSKEDGVWQATSRRLMQTDFERDPNAQAQIDGLMSRFDRILNIPVARADVGFDTREEVVRTRESGFGNLIADILREETGADIALINSGQIRGATVYQPGGLITRKSIQGELPFSDYIAMIEISGADLRAALEHSVSEVQEISGQFLQVSNINFMYDPDLPLGSRVIRVTVRGQALLPEDKLRAAMPNFIATGGDGYDMFSTAPRLYQDQSLILWERVVNNLRARSNVTFAPSGRIETAG